MDCFRKPVQLYGTHGWLLKGLAALARTDLLIGAQHGKSGHICFICYALTNK